MKPVHVILLAGGSGTRMNLGVNKILLYLAGKSVVRRSAEAFRGFAEDMIVVCREQDLEAIRMELASAALPFPVYYTFGGATRQASSAAGLSLLSDRPGDIVLIHDAARCLVDEQTIRNVISSVADFGSGIASVQITDTVKACDDHGIVSETLPREKLRRIQTPQGFIVEDLKRAFLKAETDGFTGTDDASLLEHLGISVRLTEGSSRNLKLTTPEDLRMAELELIPESSLLRIGHGYDVHRLVPDRDLILCGVKIPYEQGLLGHSDADVALHALMDALLGAAALGDIGRHFPDSDARYSGISSLLLLKEVVRLLTDRGFRAVNADVTIVAQRPKLADYIPEMIRQIASVLSLPEDRVNVKATTTERLGFEGRMEGISAQAVCLIEKRAEPVH